MLMFPSDKGLMLEMSALETDSLQEPIYIIRSVHNTKLSCNFLNRSGREIAPNTGANATTFFTLATKS